MDANVRIRIECPKCGIRELVGVSDAPVSKEGKFFFPRQVAQCTECFNVAAMTCRQEDQE